MNDDDDLGSNAYGRGRQSPRPCVGDGPPSEHGRALGEQGFATSGVRDGRTSAPPPRPVGRGPKGYVRTDDRLKEEISERLACGPHDWSELEVHVSDGEVTLTGSVGTAEIREEAERVAEGVRGVRDVTNRLTVGHGALAT